MIKKFYIILIATLLALYGVGCADDSVDDAGDEENGIHLSGLMTRADGDVYTNLHLKAFVEEDPSVTYIAETPIAVSNGLYEDVPTNITLGTPRYYPLGNNPILLYAYSGTLNGANQMSLRSGRALTNDALLSNQGYWQGEPSVLTTEGGGTPGSAKQPAETLQFRHVMTQLNIIVKVDSTETPYVDPPPATFYFAMGNNIPLTGLYDITAETPDLPTGLSGAYTLYEGINYVVPTGEDIRNFEFTQLVIDDYTATLADLSALAILNVDGSTDAALLMPGYAYNITFLIQLLEVVSIQIDLVPWVPHEVVNEDISYDPYVLNLDLGEYQNTGDDVIQKVVLYTTDSREYVGALDGNEMRFLTLPPSATVDSVDLYTSLGLLISLEPDAYTFADPGSTLTVELSEGGMRLLDPTQENSEDNPYLLSTPVQVFNIAKELDASYRMINDIDVDRLTYPEDNPLGELDIFDGTFDGNGYKVQNLIMTGSALIRRNQGIIKNLHIASGRINAIGASVAGSICAENAGILVACINEARILNAPGFVGGICGRNEDGAVVIGCVNTGDIESGVTLGGICGDNQDPDENTFLGCVNTGLLTKDGTTLGGIIGNSVTTPQVLIRNSFWLVGTAAPEFGVDEAAVGNTFDVGIDEVAALSPDKLRNGVAAREEATTSTLNLLNAALQLAGWGDEFVFVLDRETTGTVWPVPVKR